jgi:hypothetical protein
MVLGEYGFMVLVWLRGLRDLRTKIAQPPRPPWPPQPRDDKIDPKPLPTIHEGGKWESQFQHKASAQRKISCFKHFAAGRQVHVRKSSGSLSGFTANSRACFLYFSSGVFCAEHAFWQPWSLDCRSCFLTISGRISHVSLIIRAWRLQRHHNYILHGILLVVSLGLKSCQSLAGNNWGLWIAGLANYSSDLWG